MSLDVMSAIGLHHTLLFTVAKFCESSLLRRPVPLPSYPAYDVEAFNWDAANPISTREPRSI